jgi:hypothetical protein
MTAIAIVIATPSAIRARSTYSSEPSRRPVGRPEDGSARRPPSRRRSRGRTRCPSLAGQSFGTALISSLSISRLSLQRGSPRWWREWVMVPIFVIAAARHSRGAQPAGSIGFGRSERGPMVERPLPIPARRTLGTIPALPAEYCSDARCLSESVACGSFDRGHARAGFKCALDDSLGEPLVGDRTDGRRGFAVRVKTSVLTD